jgi:hypothetical protein
LVDAVEKDFEGERRHIDSKMLFATHIDSRIERRGFIVATNLLVSGFFNSIGPKQR